MLGLDTCLNVVRQDELRPFSAGARTQLSAIFSVCRGRLGWTRALTLSAKTSYGLFAPVAVGALVHFRCRLSRGHRGLRRSKEGFPGGSLFGMPGRKEVCRFDSPTNRAWAVKRECPSGRREESAHPSIRMLSGSSGATVSGAPWGVPSTAACARDRHP